MHRINAHFAGTMFMVAASFSQSGDTDKLKQLDEVPLEYRTNLNLSPIREGSSPSHDNTVSVGTIGKDYFELHGRKWPIGLIQYADDADRMFLQIASKPDCAGGWDLTIIHPKDGGRKRTWCYLSISYVSRNMVEQHEPQVYTMVLDKKPFGTASVDKKKDSVQGFFEAYQYLQDIQSLVKRFPVDSDPLAHLSRLQSLIQKALERLAQCDATILNDIHPGWGDITRDKFIPALRRLNAGLQKAGDKGHILRADALFAEFDTWLYANWDAIAEKVGE